MTICGPAGPTKTVRGLTVEISQFKLATLERLKTGMLLSAP
jgi:hypothetical protein